MIELGVAVKLDNRTLVHSAVHSNNAEMIELVVGIGAPIDGRDEYGRTPLERACASGKHLALSTLIELGASIQPGPEGFPGPLALARERNHADIAELLLSLGANPTHPDAPVLRDRSPLDWNETDDWEAYWRYRVLRAELGEWSDVSPIGDRQVAMFFTGNPGKALLVGNGISILPYMLAHMGWDVDVLDVSPTAIEYLRRTEPSPEQSENFFFDGSFEERRRSPGDVTFIVGDLRDPDLCQGPYDLVVNHRALQGFRDDDLEAMFDALDRRVARNGVLKVAVQNAGELCTRIRATFVERGYVDGYDEEVGEDETRRQIFAGVFSG